MKRMGIEALYRKPNTSKPEPGHKVYPYLLRKLAVTRPNQVWAIGITYVPMAKGFVYLVAVVDWFSRRVLAWRLLDQWAYLNKVELDFSRPGKPTDNAYIESFNRRLRQECLNAAWFLSMADARIRLNEWRDDYNQNRPHSALGNLTPSAFAALLEPARKVA